MINLGVRSDPAFHVILTTRMIDAGIVPITISDFYTTDSRATNAETLMSSLSPEDRRRAARKFRKLWRKQAKKLERQLESNKRSVRPEVIRRNIHNMRKLKPGCDPLRPEPAALACRTRFIAVLQAFEEMVTQDLKHESSKR